MQFGTPPNGPQGYNGCGFASSHPTLFGPANWKDSFVLERTEPISVKPFISNAFKTSALSGSDLRQELRVPLDIQARLAHSPTSCRE